jgi:hypothetical protein
MRRISSHDVWADIDMAAEAEEELRAGRPVPAGAPAGPFAEWIGTLRAYNDLKSTGGDCAAVDWPHAYATLVR